MRLGEIFYDTRPKHLDWGRSERLGYIYKGSLPYPWRGGWTGQKHRPKHLGDKK